MYLTQHEDFDFYGGKDFILRSKLITSERGIIRKKGGHFILRQSPLNLELYLKKDILRDCCAADGQIEFSCQ